MSEKNILSKISDDVKAVQAQGKGEIPIAGLLQYLDMLQADGSHSDRLWQMQHENSLAYYAAKNQAALEQMRAVLEAAKTALSFLVLVNGGAVVALLGTISSLVGVNGGGALTRSLSHSLLYFGAGVFCGVFAFGVRYFGQAAYAESEEKDDRYWGYGNKLRNAAVIVGLLGYALFGAGILSAYQVFGSMPAC